METEGYEKGETCNRNGCKGIIQQKDKDGCCSCHINPPCSYCEYDPSYCPECNWDAEEEKSELILNKSKTHKESSQLRDYQLDAMKYRENFYEMYSGKKEADKLYVIKNSHTHFSMEVLCVFPKGTDINSILPEIKGTFGGRLVSKSETTLKFIAYTD